MFDHLIADMWFKVPKWHPLIVQETQCVINYGFGENVFVSVSECSRSEKLHSLFGTSDTKMTKTREYYEICPEQEKRNKNNLSLDSKEYNDRHGNNVDRNIVCISINGLTNKAYNICVSILVQEAHQDAITPRETLAILIANLYLWGPVASPTPQIFCVTGLKGSNSTTV